MGLLRLVFALIILMIVLIAALEIISPAPISGQQYLPPPIYYGNTTIKPPKVVEIYPDFNINVSIINTTALYNQPILNITNNGTNIFKALLHLLSLNASEIRPCDYWEAAALTGAFIPGKEMVRNYTLHTVLFNSSANSTSYVIAVHGANVSDFVVSYPPSDLIIVNSPVYRIINQTSVNTYVIVDYYTQQYLQNEIVYGPYQVGNYTYYYIDEYWGLNIWGTAYLYANGKLVASQNFYFQSPWNGTKYVSTVYGEVEVPPGVLKEVYGSYELTTWTAYGSTNYTKGNTVYYITYFNATGPSVATQGYTFNWYEYNISVGVTIKVYNGTHPVTVIGNKTYTGRVIDTSFWFTVWSSDPVDYTSPMIVTYDHITVANYTIIRKWVAGEVIITTSSYESQQGNVINYYLTVSVDTSKIAKQPSWVFNHIPNETVYSHNYAAELYQYAVYKSISEKLWNISKSFGYPLTEYHILASEIATNMSVTNDSSLFPYQALLLGQGNLTLINDQVLFLDSFITYTNITWGTAYWYKQYPAHLYFYSVVNNVSINGTEVYPFAVSNISNKEAVVLTDVATQGSPFSVFYFYLSNGSVIPTFNPLYNQTTIELVEGWRYGPSVIEFPLNFTYVYIEDYWPNPTFKNL